MVLNKQDTVNTEDRERALSYVQDQLRAIFEHDRPAVFSISARDGLEGKQKDDLHNLEASGLHNLEDELLQFLLTEKSSEFLFQMCNRVADLLIDLGQSAEVARLLQQVNTLKIHISEAQPDVHHYAPATASSTAAITASLKFQPCEICEHIQRQSFDFLRRYQYELATNPTVQHEHAERGGFCSLHTWQYESIASPQGTCSAYPALLNRLAAWFAEGAPKELSPEDVQAGIAQLLATETSCPLCRVRLKSESEALASVIHKLSSSAMQSLSSLSAICLIHLRLLTAHLDNTEMMKQLLERESFLLRRVAEDMQRYSLKHDALRRYLTSDEERDSALKAMLLLVGHRSVSSPWRVEYIL